MSRSEAFYGKVFHNRDCRRCRSSCVSVVKDPDDPHNGHTLWYYFTCLQCGNHGSIYYKDIKIKFRRIANGAS